MGLGFFTWLVWFWMVFDILIDGVSNGGLVEGAARVIFDLLDPLLVKVLRGFELLT